MIISATHPRLWWNPTRLAQAQAWYPTHTFTPRGGTEFNAYDNALLFQLTGTASYCTAATTSALAITCSDSACNSPVNGVAADQVRWYGEYVALALDWCWNQMSSTDRDTIMNRWSTYLDNVQAHSWGSATQITSNYNLGYMRTMMEFGIVSTGFHANSENLLDYGFTTRWANNMKPFFNSEPGGVVHEGSNYGSAIEYLNTPFISAEVQGRAMPTETNFWRELAYYFVYATTLGPTFNNTQSASFYELFPFSDDERFPEGGFIEKGEGWGGAMQTIAQRLASEVPGMHARQWLNAHPYTTFRHINASDPGGTAQAFTTLPLDYYASGPAFFYGKNTWSSTGSQFQWMLGLNQDPGHGHNNLGAWQFWRNGRWLSRESVGYATTILGYSGAGTVDVNTAFAHNGLLVNGTGGSADGDSAMRTDHPHDAYTMLRLESVTDYAYAAVNLTPSYAQASTVIREFLYLRELETMVILDRLDATTTKDFLIHFYNNPTVTSASQLIEGAEGTQELRVKTLLPAAPTYVTRTEGGADGQYRVQISDTTSGQSYFLTVLQAHATTDADITASIVDNGSSWTVTLDHPTLTDVTIVFNKGMTSSGGTVQKSGGSVQNLRSTIQTIAVTSSGVVWGS